MLKFQGVADEEDGCVVPDHVVVALSRVELESKAAWVTPRIGAPTLAGDGREPRRKIRLHAWLEDGRLGVGTDVTRDLENSEAPAALGVWLTLGYPLAVPLSHLLNGVVIL